MGDVLAFETRGHTAYITLNRPEALNALDQELVESVGAAFDAVSEMPRVRCAVIGGAGSRAFCSGADLKELAARSAAGEDWTSLGADVVSPLASRCSKPLIAAIDGHAVAGGLELALICDIRIATVQSQFALPEPRRGMMAAYGLHHLSRMIPLGEALRMQLTGMPIDAVRAWQIGLVQHVAQDREELYAHAALLADAIAAGAPLAISAIRQVVGKCRDLPLSASYALAHALEQRVYASEDFREGPRAFAEKRAPVWRGL
jgi:enoyl-CoA hydratase/carnithine racemase